MTPNSQSVSTEELLCLLADPQRRAALVYLLDCDGSTASVEELTAALVAEDGVAQRSAGDGKASGRSETSEGSPGRSATDDGTTGRSVEADRVSIRLCHNHLPRLAEAGVVDYDRRSGTVRYRPHEELEALLEFVSERVE